MTTPFTSEARWLRGEKSSRAQGSWRTRQTGNGAAIALHWAAALSQILDVSIGCLRLFTASSLQESRQLFSATVQQGYQTDDSISARSRRGRQRVPTRVRKVIGATLYRAALPRSYRALARPPYSELFADVTKANGASAIMRAHVVHGYLMSEIARYLDLHPTTISRIVNRSGSYRAGTCS